MLIEEKSLKHWIDNFYGYGTWSAKFWFVAYEGSGGDLPEEVAEKLGYFNNVPIQPDGTLCDIRELYKQVAFRSNSPRENSFKNISDYRFGEKAVLNNIWKNLCAFVHGYKSKKLPDLLAYQQRHFAATNEALIHLCPLPSPHNHAWYYSWLDMPNLAFLKSRKQYEQEVYPQRLNQILLNIKKYKPEVVLMYGMNNINVLKKSLLDFFPDIKFKTVNATKLQIPQHHRAVFNGTVLLVTTQIPALRHNRIETGFDWEELGRRVRKGVP